MSKITMVIYKDLTTGRWFGISKGGKSTIRIVGPRFDGFATRKEAVEVAKMTGADVVREEW
jgi:hypothetical protein